MEFLAASKTTENYKKKQHPNPQGCDFKLSLAQIPNE
jgi:hypothetical protein